MTIGRLNALPATNWSALTIPGIDHWLWLDTTGDGIHLEGTLGAPPAEVTYLWGWNRTGTRLARLRVDRDLDRSPSDPGTVGAVLDLDGSAAGDAVVVDRIEGQVWHPSDGRINANPNHPVFAGDRLLTVFSTYREAADLDGTITQSPLTFLLLNDTLVP